MASLSRIGVSPQVGGARLSAAGGDEGVVTLMEFVGERGVDAGDELVVLFHHIQYASKRIAALVASPFNSTLGKHSVSGGGGGEGGSDRDAPKPLDIVSVRLLHFISFGTAVDVCLLCGLLIFVLVYVCSFTMDFNFCWNLEERILMIHMVYH